MKYIAFFVTIGYAVTLCQSAEPASTAHRRIDYPDYYLSSGLYDCQSMHGADIPLRWDLYSMHCQLLELAQDHCTRSKSWGELHR